jgi:hypothetical protein
MGGRALSLKIGAPNLTLYESVGVAVILAAARRQNNGVDQCCARLGSIVSVCVVMVGPGRRLECLDPCGLDGGRLVQCVT